VLSLRSSFQDDSAKDTRAQLFDLGSVPWLRLLARIASLDHSPPLPYPRDREASALQGRADAREPMAPDPCGSAAASGSGLLLDCLLQGPDATDRARSRGLQMIKGVHRAGTRLRNPGHVGLDPTFVSLDAK
jgi:hypothetical protein